MVPYHKHREIYALALSLVDAIETENTLFINYFRSQDVSVQKKALKVASKYMDARDLLAILHGHS